MNQCGLMLAMRRVSFSNSFSLRPVTVRWVHRNTYSCFQKGMPKWQPVLPMVHIHTYTILFCLMCLLLDHVIPFFNHISIMSSTFHLELSFRQTISKQQLCMESHFYLQTQELNTQKVRRPPQCRT